MLTRAFSFILLLAAFTSSHTLYSAPSLETTPIKYRFYSNLGLNIVAGHSAINSGMQFAFATQKGSPFFFGPEFHFSLFSPGSLFTPALGTWYEFTVGTVSKLTLSVGAAIGPGFSTGLASLSTTSLVILGDLTVSQVFDDLFSIRGQIRPGFVDRYFAFMMNFCVGFRFP